jgi:hypothetical protein
MVTDFILCSRRLGSELQLLRMGIIKVFFSPLTKFLKVYRSMTQGYVGNATFFILSIEATLYDLSDVILAFFYSTPEEKLEREQVQSLMTKLQQQKSDIDRLFADAQVNLINSVGSKLRDVRTAHKDLQDHTDMLNGLARSMQDPDVDKEAIFQKMQELGFNFDGTNSTTRESEKLLQRLQEASKPHIPIDLSHTMAKMNEIVAENALLGQQLDGYEHSLLSRTRLPSTEHVERAMKDAIAQGTDPEIAKQIIEKFKSPSSKSL